MASHDLEREARELAERLGPESVPDESHIRESTGAAQSPRRDTLPTVMTFNANEAERLWAELARLEGKVSRLERSGSLRDSQVAMLRAQVQGIQNTLDSYQESMRSATDAVVLAVREMKDEIKAELARR